MLNMIICFLELDEANAQLRETRKGMILFVFRLLVSHVMLQNFIGSHL